MIEHTENDGRPFLLGHFDTTFNLNDSGYPVMVFVCSDSTRGTFPLAIFIASQRTHGIIQRQLEAFKTMYQDVMDDEFWLSHVMGDADAGQRNAFQTSLEVEQLMCFFHVLYNVNKRVRGLPGRTQMSIYEEIYELHFSRNMDDFRNQVLHLKRKWNGRRISDDIKRFGEYFFQQWLPPMSYLNGETLQTNIFWRWQVFHSPTGYATTNNPCETLNRILKRFTARKKLPMLELLNSLHDYCRTNSATGNGVFQVSSCIPRKTLIDRSSLMFNTGRLQISIRDNSVLVKHINLDQLPLQDTEVDVDVEVLDALRHQGEDVEIHDAPDAPPMPLDLSNDMFTYHDFLRQNKRYLAVQEKWSEKLLETSGMPNTGWRVSRTGVCPCSYYFKFGYCIHQILTLKTLGVDIPGRERPATLVNRSHRALTRGAQGRRVRGRPRIERAGHCLNVD